MVDQENEVFVKLSKILESNSLNNDDATIDKLFHNYINDETMSFDALLSKDSRSNTNKDRVKYDLNDTTGTNINRPTPFDVWKARQKASTIKEIPKLNGLEWDKFVEKLHQSSRVKQSAMIRQQNNGLALELGGHSFKPKLNKISLEAQKGLEPIHIRTPILIERREKENQKIREAISEMAVSDCTFKPTRLSAKKTDKLLRRIGKDKSTPEELMKFHHEKLKRNELRKQVIEDIESRELTFQPRINSKSAKIEESNTYIVDPLTRTRSVVDTSIQPDNIKTTEGPVLMLESDHPYRHNANEYSTVAIPNAISYTIVFDEKTSTEQLHDYIKFFKDEEHKDYYGATKYSGGYHSTSNWPGVGNHPPLIIKSSKFVVYFKSNATINDWGFRMKITPLIRITDNDNNSIQSGKPQISQIGKSYKTNNDETTAVHDRLYQKGIEKIENHQNLQSEILSNKLKLSLKTWEKAKSLDEKKTTLRKSKFSTSAIQLDDLSIIENDDSAINVIEYDDGIEFIWRSIRNSNSTDDSSTY